MKETTEKRMREYLMNNEEQRLDICKYINGYDGSMNFCEVYDLEEFSKGIDGYKLAKAIIYGNVNSAYSKVRYDEYENILESVEIYDLYDESENYIDGIIDFIKEYNFDYIDCEELEEIYNESEEEDVE